MFIHSINQIFSWYSTKRSQTWIFCLSLLQKSFSVNPHDSLFHKWKNRKSLPQFHLRLLCIIVACLRLELLTLEKNFLNLCHSMVNSLLYILWHNNAAHLKHMYRIFFCLFWFVFVRGTYIEVLSSTGFELRGYSWHCLEDTGGCLGWLHAKQLSYSLYYFCSQKVKIKWVK